MIPIAELRAWVGATADPTTDALLLQLEAHALAQVELTTGAYLGPEDDFVDRIIGDGTTELRLPRGPVTDVSYVEESWRTDAEPVPVDVPDYAIRSPLLIRTGGGVWTRGAEFEVEYTAGYDAADVPPLYRQAVLEIVKATYDAQAASLAAGEEFKKETFGDYSYERFAAAPTASDASGSVKAILAQLPRRVRV